MLTQETYRTPDYAELCPRCASTAWIGNLHVDVVGDQASQPRSCLACGLEWSAVFRLAGYVRDGDDDGEADAEALFHVACRDTRG